MSAHLVLVAGSDASRNSAERNVVCGAVVLENSRKGEVDLQHTLISLPIHFVHALYPIVDGIHANVLHKG